MPQFFCLERIRNIIFREHTCNMSDSMVMTTLQI